MGAIQDGGSPGPRTMKDGITAGLRYAASSKVLTAIESGAMRAARIRAVMIATATPRLPPVTFCTHSIAGHVATTSVVAQISAPRNGSSVQKLDRKSTRLNSSHLGISY